VTYRLQLASCLSIALSSGLLAQDAQERAARPNLPPRLQTQWDKAEKTVEENRKRYLQANQKALEEFAKQVARIDPNAEVKELCDEFKAIVMEDAPEVEVPVLGRDILVAQNGHKYKLFEDNLSWHEAQTKCQAEGGYLWVIDNQQEHAFVWQALRPVLRPGNEQFWLGGKKNEQGGWVWLSGGPIANLGWENHFPVGDRGKEVLAMNGGGKLINERPHNRPGMRFVCEWDK
jgi:hypothetical protein